LGATKKAVKAGEEAEQKKVENRKLGTKPSHPLADYVGKFNNEAYGIFEIKPSGDTLAGKFNTIELKISHFHYDVFTANLDGNKINYSVTSNLRGEIEAVEIELQEGVKPIRFERFNEGMKIAKNDLEKFVGDYELMGTVIKCLIRRESLFLSVPGQPEYELLATDKLKFDLKDLKGFRIEFTEENGKIKAAILDQPNGKFTANRKQ
jgi:hypothetical protein